MLITGAQEGDDHNINTCHTHLMNGASNAITAGILRMNNDTFDPMNQF
jgi:hypothetical protein